MLKQKSKADSTEYQFEQLEQSSPQLKPHQESYQDQFSSTERSDNIDKSSPNMSQSITCFQKQSTLIKVIPVLNLNQEQNQHQKILNQQKYQQRKNKRRRNFKLQNKNYQQISSKEGQSPILFNVQIQEEEEKSQIIGFSPPQSSRRGLNPKRRQKKTKEFPQITQKTQKTQSTYRQEQNIFKNQKNKQNQRNKQQLSTQIYKYQEQSNQSQPYQESQQQQDYQQEEKDKVNQIQQTFQRKLKIEQNHQDKKQIFFKSNSFFTLINAQIPKEKHINCVLRKKKQGIFSMTTKYELFLFDDKKYLMTAVKTTYGLTSHFQFYKDKEILANGKKNKGCLYGILDSNFSGTQYVLKTVVQYDTISERSTAIDKRQMILQQSQTVISDQGSHQKIQFQQTQKKVYSQTQPNGQLQIKEVCYINFKASLMGLGGQRDVKILKKNNKKIAKTEKFSDIKNAYDNGQFQKLKQIKTRKAQKGSQGYQLDFKGFAKVNSDKNIILQNSKGIQNLIFGKAKQDVYFLSIGHPFSILQGFAFGVSNLDGKIFVN